MDQQTHGRIDAVVPETVEVDHIQTTMNIVLFSHPAFTNSQSMRRFARMLEQAYLARGHKVQVWSPKAGVCKWVPCRRLAKLAGYVDQHLLFPLWMRKQLKVQPPDTLFVFCDQALGPWVPLVMDLAFPRKREPSQFNKLNFRFRGNDNLFSASVDS